VLRILNELVEPHGDEAENDDARYDEMELEYLASVYNQIAETVAGGEKFPDDDAYERQADIDLHRAQYGGDGAGEYDLEKDVPFRASEGVDQSDLFLVYLMESGVETDNAAEDRYGNAGYDDRIHAGAQPYDEKGRQGGLGQAVQNYQIGLHNFRKAFGIPEQRGAQEPEQDDEQKAGYCFKQRNSDMPEDGMIHYHGDKAGNDAARAAEKETVDHVQIGAELPQAQKENEEQKAQEGDGMVVLPVLF